MQTPDLIRVLASGLEPVPRGAARRRLGSAGVLGLVASLVVMVSWIGFNPALAEAMAAPHFLYKTGFPLLLALTAFALLERLARPGTRLGRLPLLPLGVFAVAALAALAACVATAPAALAELIFADTWRFCPPAILALSLPAYGAALWALRGLAPVRLRLAGGVAGLFAGALAAFVYAWHCPQLAIPFVTTWYSAGIALAAAGGALLGPRALRW